MCVIYSVHWWSLSRVFLWAVRRSNLLAIAMLASRTGRIQSQQQTW